ncbi:MAG: hypothetical protein FWD89_05055 [Firmicutes bacterium]|nr:hypothetical protein [Bacillota bacterium]MCL2771651.1 hypothetical protein [Bacillota bacterium]
MIKQEFKDAYDKFTNAWGDESQYRMCIEEMSELTKELCKFIRLENIEPRTPEIEEKIAKQREKIVEEIADVLNTVEQMQYMFGEEEVDRIRTEKVAREMKRSF